METVQDVLWAHTRDNATLLAAGLAFYSFISLAPSALFTAVLLSSFVEREVAQQELLRWADTWLSAEAAAQVGAAVEGLAAPRLDSWAAWLALGLLIFGATRVLAMVQVILNLTFGVRAGRMSVGRAIWFTIRKRLLALALMSLVSVSMLVSLLLNAGVQAASRFASVELLVLMPSSWMSSILVPMALGASMLTLVIRVLPDAEVSWRDAAVGALVTSVFFNLGKVVIERHLASEAATSAFGAAASLLAVLLWLYYSAWIFIVGMAFTDAWARRVGYGIRPRRYHAATPGHDRTSIPPTRLPPVTFPVASDRASDSVSCHVSSPTPPARMDDATPADDGPLPAAD